jgi:hypothetical protein
MMTWRLASKGDLPRINEIADTTHIDLPERPEVFEEKFNLFPKGCYIFETDGSTFGYGFSHPWMLGAIPPLDAYLEKLPASPECLYVHDVAILPEARGHGAAGSYILKMVDVATKCGIPSLALVSVYNTDRLWSRYGFKIVDEPSLTSKLVSYGETAKYMTRHL